MTQQEFSLGTLEVTTKAAAVLAASGADPATFLVHHQPGDWGNVDEADRSDNDYAATHGHSVCSLYPLANNATLVIETVADRSRTLLSLIDEYKPVREVDSVEGYAIWASSYNRQKNPLIAVEEVYANPLVDTLSVASVLDVGTGTGRHALRWARRGATVTAIDQSPEMLAVAEQTAHAEGLPITFVRGTIEDGLPLASGQFDLVICALMLCHVPNLTQILQECARVLRPGGYLLITDSHPAVAAHGWQAALLRPGITYVVRNALHTRSDYLEAVVAAGCSILHVVDVPVRDIPDGYVPEIKRDHAEKLFCLILLAQRPAASTSG